MTKGCSKDLQNVYQNGCYGEIKKFLNDEVDSVNIIIMILAVIQVNIAFFLKFQYLPVGFLTRIFN